MILHTSHPEIENRYHHRPRKTSFRRVNWAESRNIPGNFRRWDCGECTSSRNQWKGWICSKSTWLLLSTSLV